MQKQCKDCKEVKPVEEFYRQQGGTPHSYCKVCKNLRARKTQKNNPEMVAEWNRRNANKRRCEQYGRVFDRSIDLAGVAKRDKNMCGICGELVTTDGVVDHILAISNGGNHTWDNVQLAHHLCNIQKGYDRNT